MTAAQKKPQLISVQQLAVPLTVLGSLLVFAWFGSAELQMIKDEGRSTRESMNHLATVVDRLADKLDSAATNGDVAELKEQDRRHEARIRILEIQMAKIKQ